MIRLRTHVKISERRGSLILEGILTIAIFISISVLFTHKIKTLQIFKKANAEYNQEIIRAR